MIWFRYLNNVSEHTHLNYNEAKMLPIIDFFAYYADFLYEMKIKQKAIDEQKGIKRF